MLCIFIHWLLISTAVHIHKRLRSPIYIGLRKSHRTVGLLLVVFVLILSGTGILLNHSEDLSLDSRYVPAFIAARYYPNPQQREPNYGFVLATDYYFAIDGRLFAGVQDVGFCDKLQGVTQFGKQLVVLCDGELVFFNEALQLIERLKPGMGLPTNSVQLATVDGMLVIEAEGHLYKFNMDELTAEPFSGQPPVWNKLVQIPDDLLLGEVISWQQFILDIHSSMFVGAWGKWFSDLIAVCLSGMAVSGFTMWYRQRPQ